MPQRAFKKDRPIAGAWWVATNPERRVPGVLERNAAGNGVLSLEDILVESPTDEDRRARIAPIPLILGETGIPTRRVSLFDCHEVGRRNAKGWAPGPKTHRFVVRYALDPWEPSEGDQLETAEHPDPPIYGVWTRLDVLDEWGDRGDFVTEKIPLEHHQDGTYSSTFTLRWPVDLRSTTRLGEITLCTPPSPVSTSSSDYHLDIERNCYLNCSLDPAIPLSKLFERLLIPLRAFFAFASDSEPDFTQLTLSLAPDDNYGSNLWCAKSNLEADGNARVLTDEEAYLVVSDGFFRLRDIEGKFDSVIAKWFDLFEKLETPIASILAAAAYGGGRLTSDRFMSAAVAAEALHRSLELDASSLSAERKVAIVGRMLGVLTVDEQSIDWLVSRIQHSIDPRYQDRIAQLVQMSPVALRDAAGDDFAKCVKKARNYFAHLSDAYRRPEDSELHRLTSLLVLVMVAHLLQELGIDDVESRIRYSDRFWELRRRGVILARKTDDGRELFSAARSPSR